MIQKHCCLLWAKVDLKWTGATWKTVLGSGESKSEVHFGKHEHFVLWTKEDRSQTVFYQCSIQKSSFVALVPMELTAC